MIILAPMSAAEVGYFLSRSSDSGAMGDVGNYTATLQFENVVLVEDEEYIGDGETIDFDYLLTQIDREDGFQVAEVQMVWTYDETNEEADQIQSKNKQHVQSTLATTRWTQPSENWSIMATFHRYREMR